MGDPFRNARQVIFASQFGKDNAKQEVDQTIAQASGVTRVLQRRQCGIQTVEINHQAVGIEIDIKGQGVILQGIFLRLIVDWSLLS
jgi:hypothetical protein